MLRCRGRVSYQGYNHPFEHSPRDLPVLDKLSNVNIVRTVIVDVSGTSRRLPAAILVPHQDVPSCFRHEWCRNKQVSTSGVPGMLVGLNRHETRPDRSIAVRRGNVFTWVERLGCSDRLPTETW
jgi:hypothetical protein